MGSLVATELGASVTKGLAARAQTYWASYATSAGRAADGAAGGAAASGWVSSVAALWRGGGRGAAGAAAQGAGGDAGAGAGGGCKRRAGRGADPGGGSGGPWQVRRAPPSAASSLQQCMRMQSWRLAALPVWSKWEGWQLLPCLVARVEGDLLGTCACRGRAAAGRAHGRAADDMEL